VSSQYIGMAGRQVAAGLWAEIESFGELWLRLVSWLIDENGRALASLPSPLAPWLVLLAIVAGRALFLSLDRAQMGMQRPTGGTR
jgi:hypothetical protein